MTRNRASNGVKLRPFTGGDWEAVCRVHDAARPDELKGSCDPRAFIQLSEDPEADDLRRSQIVVAEVDGEIIGFGAADGSYLSFLYVHPDHYRRGVGRRLLEASLDLAEPDPWTIVLAGNVPAIALSESFGFREAARYESDNNGYPVTCLRMRRTAADQA